MKTFYKLLFMILLLAVALALPAQVSAQTPPPGSVINGDQTVFGNTFELAEGQTLNGDLAVFGGSAVIAEGAVVNGDIAMLGSQLDLAGEVYGTVVVAGGSINLRETAFVNGEVNAFSSTVSQEEGADVTGGITRERDFNWNDFDFGRTRTNPFVDAGRSYFDLVGSILWRMLQVFGVAVLATLVVLLLPRYSRNVIDTMAAQPIVAGGIGLLTIALIPFVILILVLLVLTVILFPVTLAGILVIAAALLFGWIAVGYQLGKLIETSLKQDWAEPVVAGVGTLGLGLGSWLIGYIPCLGPLLIMLIAAIGLGGVVLSRFGMRVSLPTPPAPPAAPVLPSTGRIVDTTIPDPDPLPPTPPADSEPPVTP